MLTQLPTFCFVFRFDSDPNVIGVAHQRIRAAYEACDPKLLVQKPSSLFKDFDVDRSQLSPEEKVERDAMDALREMKGSKEQESEETRSAREDRQRKLEEESAANQAKWKGAERLDEEGKEQEKRRLDEENKKKEMEKQAEEERKQEEERLAQEKLAQEKREADLLAKKKQDDERLEEANKNRAAQARNLLRNASSGESDSDE